MTDTAAWCFRDCYTCRAHFAWSITNSPFTWFSTLTCRIINNFFTQRLSTEVKESPSSYSCIFFTAEDVWKTPLHLCFPSQFAWQRWRRWWRTLFLQTLYKAASDRIVVFNIFFWKFSLPSVLSHEPLSIYSEAFHHAPVRQGDLHWNSLLC